MTTRCGMDVEDIDEVMEVMSAVNGLAFEEGIGWYMIAGEE